MIVGHFRSLGTPSLLGAGAEMDPAPVVRDAEGGPGATGGVVSLPNEILNRIVDLLVPELRFPGSQPSEGRHRIPAPPHVMAAATLRQLCLTSRRLWTIAVPRLYCSISLSRNLKFFDTPDPGPENETATNLPASSRPIVVERAAKPGYFFVADTLVLLLRTLLESPRLRCFVQRLDCSIFLTK